MILFLPVVGSFWVRRGKDAATLKVLRIEWLYGQRMAEIENQTTGRKTWAQTHYFGAGGRYKPAEVTP